MQKKQPEFELQKAVCRWLSFQFPKVLYLSDTVASVKLTIPQQNRNKLIQKNDFHPPDLLILEPNKEYKGLFIELKVKSIYKKDGVTLLKSEHLENQQKTINELKAKGYYACFSWSLEMTLQKINSYMTNQ